MIGNHIHGVPSISPARSIEDRNLAWVDYEWPDNADEAFYRLKVRIPEREAGTLSGLRPDGIVAEGR